MPIKPRTFPFCALLLAGAALTGCESHQHAAADHASHDHPQAVLGAPSEAHTGPVLPSPVVAPEATPASSAAPQATADAPAPVDHASPADHAPPAQWRLAQKWADHKPQPSLNGLDRSDWEPVRFVPDSGVVYHYNYYHRDFPTRFEARRDARLSRMLQDPTVTLDDVKAAWFTTDDNQIGFVAQPVKFAFDTAAMFPVMLFLPPWGEAQTPLQPTFNPAMAQKGLRPTLQPVSDVNQGPVPHDSSNSTE